MRLPEGHTNCWIGGDTAQSNEADSTATVDNSNTTNQVVDQSQDAGATATGGDSGSGDGDHRCGCPDDHKAGNGGDGGAPVTQDQVAGVANGTSQGGSATVDNTQENRHEPSTAAPSKPSKPSHGCGCPQPVPSSSDGVEQSNAATNHAAVASDNATNQAVDQTQDANASAHGGDGGDGHDGNHEGCGCAGDHKGDGKDHHGDGKHHKGDGKHHRGYAKGHKGGGKHDCGCPKPRHGGDGGDAFSPVGQSQVASVANRLQQGGDAVIFNEQRNRNRERSPLRNVRQLNQVGNAAGVSNRNASGQTLGHGQLARSLVSAR